MLELGVDVRDRAGLRGAIERVADEWGGVTVAVSNAGTNRRRVVALWDDFAMVEALLDLDLLAAVDFARLVAPFLIRSADAGQRPLCAFMNTLFAQPRFVDQPGVAPYETAKAGLAAFARVFCSEVRNLGVRVGSIFPGLVATGLGMQKNVVGTLLPQEELIQPEECARSLLYMLDASCWVTEVGLDTTQHSYPALRSLQLRWARAHPWRAPGSAKL